MKGVIGQYYSPRQSLLLLLTSMLFPYFSSPHRLVSSTSYFLFFAPFLQVASVQHTVEPTNNSFDSTKEKTEFSFLPDYVCNTNTPDFITCRIPTLLQSTCHPHRVQVRHRRLQLLVTPPLYRNWLWAVPRKALEGEAIK